MNIIQHNHDPMPTSFFLLVLDTLLCCYCCHFCCCYFVATAVTLLLLLSLCCYWLLLLLLLSHYFATDTLLQILNLSGVVELTTQLLILENILSLPLDRINKFGLNTLPSKTVAIPYTCGLSRPFSGAVAGEL